MCRELNRNGLRKYLGRREAFEGTFKELDEENNKILIIDITLKGKKKVLAEHLWIDLPQDRLEYAKGCMLGFLGRVISYRDTFSYLKYGVNSIHSLREVTEITKNASKKNTHDNKHAYNRRRKR